jgi:Tfp pilus assembly protein PilE
MQEKYAAGIFLEIVAVVTMLGVLAAIAIPHASQMTVKSRPLSSEAELETIQTAVVEMLQDSVTQTLEPVGPTTDMSLVCTNDTPPLLLSYYLLDTKEAWVKLNCAYSFTADGTVYQYVR